MNNGHVSQPHGHLGGDSPLTESGGGGGGGKGMGMWEGGR